MANVTGGPTEPDWLNKGDNAWQLTAATFVGLQSFPGLVVLYAGKKAIGRDRPRKNSAFSFFSRGT